MGAAITVGESRPQRTSAGASSGIIPVAVAPPGSSMLTLTPVPARSAAMIWERDSAAAREGP